MTIQDTMQLNLSAYSTRDDGFVGSTTDYLFVGAGPANLYSIIYLLSKGVPGEHIMLIDKGKDIFNRDKKELINGMAGAGAFSDYKCIFSTQKDQPVIKHLGEEETLKYYNLIKLMTTDMHPDPTTIGITEPSKLRDDLIKNGVSQKSEQGWNELAIKQSLCWHVGSTMAIPLIENIHNLFVTNKVNMIWESEISQINKHYATFNTLLNNLPYTFNINYNKVFIALGRAGKKSVDKLTKDLGVEAVSDEIHIGVRFETDYNKTIEELITNFQYDFKFSKMFNNKEFMLDNETANIEEVRTFCCNHGSAEVVYEEVDSITEGKRLQANGHGYGLHDKEHWTNTSNWAILCTLTNCSNVDKILESIEDITGKGVKVINSNSSDEIYNFITKGAGSLGDTILEFIESLQPILKYNDWKIHFPEIKTIGSKLPLTEYFNLDGAPSNIHFIGDSALTRGIVPAAVTGLKAISKYIDVDNYKGVK